MPISVSGSTVTFTAAAGQVARARSAITTASPTQEVSFRFTVARRALKLRVGTTAGGQELIADITYLPGTHILSFTPGAGTYYAEFSLADEGVATLSDFVRLAPGLLELPTPYTADDLQYLRQEQSADTVWFYLRRLETRALERRSGTSWGLRVLGNEDGPWEVSDDGVTLTPSARTGVATIDASGPVFRSTDQGALLKLTHLGQFISRSFSASGQNSDPIKITGKDANRDLTITLVGTFSGTMVLQQSIGSDVAWTNYQSYTGATSTLVNDGLTNQIVYYRWRCTTLSSGSVAGQLVNSLGVTEGVARIATVNADNQVTADVFRPFGAASATAEWQRAAWSDRYGWPACGAVHDGRHWLARDDLLWGSASDDYVSFAVGAQDADAIGRRIATGDINLARWLETGARLMVGAAGAEIEVRSDNLDGPITPTSMVIRGRSTRGSANVAAAKLDDSICFISRSRERIYRLAFNAENQGYDPFDLTRLHATIAGEGGFRELAVQLEPEPRLWAIRNDGQCAVLLIEPKEQVFGWQRLVTDGVFESVTVTPGTPEDAVYFVVRRTVNGVTKRYVEKLTQEYWTDIREAWRVHSGLRYSGSPVSTLSGLEHLEGKTVQIWADGRAHTSKVVASGSITLDRAASVVIAGLGYSGRYRGPRMAFTSAQGAALTQWKRITRLGMLVHRTPGGCLRWGRDYNNTQTLPSHVAGDLMDSPLTLQTVDVTAPFEGETALDPRLHVVMDQPGPAEILGLFPTFETYVRG